MRVKRGDLFWCNFEPSFGHEQGRTRPCVIIQNNLGNSVSPLTIVAPITSRIYKNEFPFHVVIEREDSKLKKKSVILLNQIRVIDKRRLQKRIGILNDEIMEDVNQAIRFSLGIED